MVKRPLGVTTHTALGTPVSVSSTCSWPPSGMGISTEPRSSRANSATAGSSKSSMSNGPSSSSDSSGSAGSTWARLRASRRLDRVFAVVFA